jgi:hypothetical protein
MRNPHEFAAQQTLAKEMVAIGDNLADRMWRLNNLYWITTESGELVKFHPNEAQLYQLEHMHNRNIVLKSRRHGFTTQACLLALDTALFRANTHCGLVMHVREKAEEAFRDKILFAYERLPAAIRAAVPIRARDNTGHMELENGSTIRVSTSHRGGTLQYLHVSEYGPMCVLFPQKAKELKTGALNTVSPECIVTIESTMAGSFGDYHDMCKTAMDHQQLVDAGEAAMTSMDYRLHFFAWWQKSENRLDPHGVIITEEDAEYFAGVERETGTKLDPAQRAWYVKKKAEQGEDMLREHPSTPEEAFQASVEGAYYTKQMQAARGEGRIGRVPHVPGNVVNTFWDIGHNDATSLWFHQQLSLENRFIRSYEQAGEHYTHFVGFLQRMALEEGYVFGTHFLPHDAEHATLSAESVRSLLEDALPGQRFEIVARTPSVWTGIQQTQQIMATCYWDAVLCADGLKALDAYRKHFDAKHGIFTTEPEHDEFSNYADAFRQFGQGYKPAQRIVKPPSWQKRLKELKASRSTRNAMSA